MKRDLEYKTFNNLFKYINWSDSGDLLHIAHGTGLCSGVYTEFSKILAEKFKVIGLDFRGHGNTKAPAEPTKLKNWEIFNDDLEVFFSSFNRPIIAVGHSMGGTVSAVIAARYPSLVSKLVLIEPGFMPPLWRPFVYFVQKTGVSMHVPFVTSVTKRNKYWKNKASAFTELQSKGPFKSWRNEILEDYIQEGTEKSIDDESIKLRCNPLWEGRILATAPCGVWSEVSRIKVPTLVLHGAKSKTFLPSVVTKIKKLIPHAVVKEMPHSGHFIPMENPEDSAEIILSFIQEGNVRS